LKLINTITFLKKHLTSLILWFWYFSTFLYLWLFYFYVIPASLGARSYNVFVYENTDAGENLVTTVSEEGLTTSVTLLKAGTSYRIEVEALGENEVPSVEQTATNAITCKSICSYKNDLTQIYF